MNKLFRVVLVGPTGAGKSQFCNFLHNDLTNSIYKVSNSLNSCTLVPKSTIVERQNIKIELIDSPGSSDSNNNDEDNLKALATFLRSKNEIHQIFLVLNFEDRFCKDTRDYLKILSTIFPPNQFLSNLMVVFTHYPIELDEEYIDKANLYKRELKDELNKIFQAKENVKNNEIPVYFINTKIFKKNQNPYFNQKSIRTAFDLIEELKVRS